MDMYEVRQNKDIVSRRPNRHNNRTTTNTNIIVESNDSLYKRVKANAIIADVSSLPIKYLKIQSEGSSNSGRSNNPNNKDIQNKLTSIANRFETNKEKVNRILNGLKKSSKAKRQVVSTIKIIDKVYRNDKLVGWGNCAEPHSVYNIARNLKDNQYIIELTVDKAVTIENGVSNKHDKEHDKRCLNCEQWAFEGKPSYFPKD